jgi:hypothetical protein
MRSRPKNLLILLGGCVLSWSLRADAHPRLQRYTGDFHSSQVECDTLCTGGPFSGGLAGTLSWRMESMEATSDPNVVRLVGVDTVTTSRGSLSGPDYTLWNLASGEFIDVALIERGTLDFAGARGTLIIRGSFDAATGQGRSDYVALLSLPH